jgi:hypothetical protein
MINQQLLGMGSSVWACGFLLLAYVFFMPVVGFYDNQTLVIDTGDTSTFQTGTSSLVDSVALATQQPCMANVRRLL